MKLSEVFDALAVVAIAAGCYLRVGLWLALIVAGTLVIASNWMRAR